MAACHIGLVVHALLGSVNCLTIRRHHRVHVLRRLHAAFNLKRANARLNHVRHVINSAVILRAEQPVNAAHRDNFMLRVEQLIGQTARLSAGSAVSRAVSSHRRHVADARIAEAQGAVAKTLQLNAKLGNSRNLFFSELSREGDATHAKLFTSSNTARIVDVCLRRYVTFNLWPGLSGLGHKTPVLDNKGICAKDPRAANQAQYTLHFVPLNNNVNGDVHASAS